MKKLLIFFIFFSVLSVKAQSRDLLNIYKSALDSVRVSPQLKEFIEKYDYKPGLEVSEVMYSACLLIDYRDLPVLVKNDLPCDIEFCDDSDVYATQQNDVLANLSDKGNRGFKANLHYLTDNFFYIVLNPVATKRKKSNQELIYLFGINKDNSVSLLSFRLCHVE